MLIFVAMHHEHYMDRCLQLARLGASLVAPNPMVGAVLVYVDQIIGEGYHEQYGKAHAEVNCINSVPAHLLQCIPASTLYVSLEPCAHYGKTPPCALLIIEQQIKKVVIACRDTFDAVDGRGIELLKEAGVEVIVGVMEKEARALNKRFFTFHEKKRPYIFLKWAQTIDGFIAMDDFKQLAISNDLTNRYTHSMRATEAAIVIGTRTALYDNPSLTLRHWAGMNPVRVFVDKALQVPSSAFLYNGEARSIVFTNIQKNSTSNMEYVKLNEKLALAEQISGELYQKNINSMIVEGGKELLQHFIDLNLWDEALIITNTGLAIGSGVKSPLLNAGHLKREWYLRKDRLQLFLQTKMQ